MKGLGKQKGVQKGEKGVLTEEDLEGWALSLKQFFHPNDLPDGFIDSHPPPWWWSKKWMNKNSFKDFKREKKIKSGEDGKNLQIPPVK